jgi:hypothetical protein
MRFDIRLSISPSFGIREYSHASGITQGELARDIQDLSKQVARIGNETRQLLALIAELQNVTQGATGVIRHTVAAVANLNANVTPPEDIMAVARVELSEPAFARLMDITGGSAPTPEQLAREVDFERYGVYPQTPSGPDRRKLAQIGRDGVLIATAMSELSWEGYRKLMLANDLRPPTPQQLCEAVEAERAAGISPSTT